MNRKVIFRADGGVKKGYGHFIRTLGIAGLINKDFHCVYVTINPTEYQINEIYKACDELVVLNNIQNQYEDFLNYLNGDEIVVIDSYEFKSIYQLKIKDKGCKVIYIDDNNDKSYVCDILINNIPGFTENSFHKMDYTKLCLGIDYALLRKEFFNPALRKIKKKKGSIFLSFGGGDYLNISQKVIDFLYSINRDVEINLLIGDAYQFRANLKKYNFVKIHQNINASEVGELIAASEICIIPASSLLNEAASIGSKILVGFFAENQIKPYEYFVNNKLAIGLGDYRDLNLEFFKERLEQLTNSYYLVENQKKIYRYQQEENLRSIFKNV